MARKNLFEIISTSTFDASIEYSKLYKLFFVNKIKENTLSFSPELAFEPSLGQYINEYVFQKLPIRGTCTSLEEMMQILDLEQPKDDSVLTLDDLLTFCEMIINILKQGAEYTNHRDVQERAKVVIDNITKIMDQTNNSIYETAEGLIIYEKSFSSSKAAAVSVDKSLRQSIFEYKRFDFVGDLENKRKIITNISRFYEPIRKNLKENGFVRLEDKISFLLNNLDLRHNNRDGNHKNKILDDIKDEELETFYNTTYELLLLAIITNDNLKPMSDIDALQKKMRG